MRRYLTDVVIIGTLTVGGEAVPAAAPPPPTRIRETPLAATVRTPASLPLIDVPGLEFDVASGTAYYFKAVVLYKSSATTNGSRWSVNGPAASALGYVSRYASSATARTINNAITYDVPAAANTAGVVTNVATVEGFITPSAAGTVIVRAGTELTAGWIEAQPGSYIEWEEVA